MISPSQPSGESIVELVDRAAASGLQVRLVIEGMPAELPAMVERAAHRVVQEALTNAAKHAPGAAVTVRLRHSPTETLLTVTNDAPTQAASPGVTSGQHGLVGLVERVRLVGGTLHYGPNGEGFEITARLPHQTGASLAPSGERSLQSESASELATVRSRVRRGLVTAIAAPLALGAGLGAVMLGYYLVIGYNAVLKPPDYEQLRVGQQRSEIEPLLPSLQMVDAPLEKEPPRPAEATCEFYRPDGPFSITFAYRLCFADGTLASKDVIQSGSVPADESAP